MTPSMLQDAVAEALGKLFEGKRWKKPEDGEDTVVPLAVFKQNVPLSKYGEEGNACFPYLLVSISDWQQASMSDPVICKIIILVGIFDDDEELQGHKDLLDILASIELFFKKNIILDNKYRLEYPIKGIVSEEDSYPYFFGALETSWQLMSVYGNRGEEENI